MPLSPKFYAFGCGCFAALGACVFGYDLAVISAVFAAPDFLEITGVSNDTNFQGFIVSSMLLGAFVGSIPASLIADAFSRRASLTYAGCVFLVGGALQTAAQNKGMMLAGRFFAGLAIGALGTLVPLYQSEISHPRERGRIMATFQFFLGIGAFVATWIAYGCANHQYGTGLQWRLPIGFQMVPAVPLVVLTYMLPESPRWLMVKGRREEAIATLARLHAKGNVHDSFVLQEIADMDDTIQNERAAETSWRSIFTSTLNIRKIMLGIILQFSVQLTGVAVIQYYSVRIYESVGFSGSTVLLIQAINNVVALCAEVACILFLDKLGRRAPLIWCNAGAAVCFAIAIPLVKAFNAGHGSFSKGVAFIAITYLFNIIFSFGIGPLSWVYPTEILNTGIRAKGSALAAMSSWIANFMMGQVAPKAFDKISWRFYLVFCVCSATNALTFYLFYPETKNRTLEEMDEYFRKGHLFVIRDRDIMNSLSVPAGLDVGRSMEMREDLKAQQILHGEEIMQA